MLAKTFGGCQVEHVSRHLIAVGHPGIFVAACSSLAATHTDDALANTVVEQTDIELLLLVFVEQSCIDQVRTLSLHGAVLLLGSLGKLHTAVYQCAVE